jgi:hypothetical protein
MRLVPTAERFWPQRGRRELGSQPTDTAGHRLQQVEKSGRAPRFLPVPRRLAHLWAAGAVRAWAVLAHNLRHAAGHRELSS